MIKEVIFDIDDTLYDYEVGHAQGMEKMGGYAQRELGIDAEEFKAAYQKHSKEITKRLGRDNAAIHSRSIRLQNLLEQWEKPLFPHMKELYHLYWDTLLSVSAPEPGSLEAVKELAAQGISIGIGTDMTTRMQYEKLEQFGFAPYVKHIVTSQEAGFEKPHPEFMGFVSVKRAALRRSASLWGIPLRRMCWAPWTPECTRSGITRRVRPLPEDVDLAGKDYREIHHFDELAPYILSLA